jgi:hypothetical protein
VYGSLTIGAVSRNIDVSARRFNPAESDAVRERLSGFPKHKEIEER